MAWNPILLVFNPYVTPMKVACLMSLIIQRKSKNRKYSRQILLVQARWALFILIRLWPAHQNTIKIRLHSAVFRCCYKQVYIFNQLFTVSRIICRLTTSLFDTCLSLRWI